MCGGLPCGGLAALQYGGGSDRLAGLSVGALYAAVLEIYQGAAACMFLAGGQIDGKRTSGAMAG